METIRWIVVTQSNLWTVNHYMRMCVIRHTSLRLIFYFVEREGDVSPSSLCKIKIVLKKFLCRNCD